MTDQPYFGQMGITDASSDFHLISFLIHQALERVRTATQVKIIAVHGGGVGAAPTLDVQPVVKMADGVGNSASHGTIYGVQCARNQGGAGAIINDPQVGDIGHLVCSDRDHSNVAANGGKESTQGSNRRHNLADGVYHGAVSNSGTPTTYVHFRSDGGIEIIDKAGNKIVTQAIEPYVYIEPAPGHFVYLGGDGVTGSYDFVQTMSGPSINVKARFS